MSEITERLRVAIADRYTIERELGAGGMATVYLAQDLKHDRKVALKVLRPELAAVLGADRFVQEIKTTAALQHPHILPLFDSGTAGGLTDEASTAQPLNRSTAQFLYYVMPYIEGETLRDKLTRETQLSIDEAVKITSEVADALDYAHRQGVIHRDIKPENILLHDGRPMVADFGIALAVSAAAGGRMTETGMSLGTPHYMSPEQATADKDITARSDVYSLASMLYEMLTGEPPHMGNSAQQIIMKIIAETAKPVTELRKSVPPNVAAAVGRALEKLPADRFDSAKAFADALANPGFTSATLAGGAAVVPLSRRAAVTPLLAAGFVFAIALAAWGWFGRTALEAGQSEVAFYLDPPDSTSGFIGFAFSPDGSRIVADVATDEGHALYQRPLDQPDWQVISGTAEAGNTSFPVTPRPDFPFFSPDGAWVGFSSRDGTLKRVQVEGGAAQTIAQLRRGLFGASWAEDNTVVYSTYPSDTAGRPVLFRVAADGGVPEQLTALDTVPGWHLTPHHLRGGAVLLFQIIFESSQTTLAALSLESGKVARLGPGNSPRVDGLGRVVYGTEDRVVMARPFNPRTLAFEGPPRLVADRVSALVGGSFALYAVSAEGDLVYQSQSSVGDEMVLVDREGRTRTLQSGYSITHPRFSPSGDRIAFIRVDAGNTDRGEVHVYSLANGTAQLLSHEGAAADPAWSSDGRFVAYSAPGEGEAGPAKIFRRAADGTGSAELLVASDADSWQTDFVPGDREIVFLSGNDLFRFTIGSDTPPTPLLETQANEQHASVSPDGRWLAYTSNETGADEVYVRSYPNMGPRTLVSVGGGNFPVWAADGTELFYWGRGQQIAASLRHEGNGVNVVGRTELFRTTPFQSSSNRNYDVHPNGQEFVMVRGAQGGRAVVRLGALQGEGQ